MRLNHHSSFTNLYLEILKWQTNFVAENFLQQTVPRSIHNIAHHRHIHFELPFTFQRTRSRRKTNFLAKNQYILRYPFETTFNNIFNRCFHFHQRHIHTTSVHPTHSKLPRQTPYSTLFNPLFRAVIPTLPNPDRNLNTKPYSKPL
jgi:hypothetical protein